VKNNSNKGEIVPRQKKKRMKKEARGECCERASVWAESVNPQGKKKVIIPAIRGEEVGILNEDNLIIFRKYRLRKKVINNGR